MTLKQNIGEADDPKIEKYVSRLKEPARRAKQSVQDGLEKSIKRFQDQEDKSTSEKDKSVFFKKKEKISKDLDVLKVLSEDEIIRYALSTSKNIMPIASNPRLPREDRMKARVAAHKPLFTHIARLKQKLITESQSASESENDQDKKSTLNKITFNNIIVLMRKDVRRAKVHIIHKLTRNIKKLRAAKGKEDKVVKNQRKAERLHNKVIHIKELLEDDISKFALSTTQDPYKLAIDIKIPMTSQALATVAINQFVVPHVRDFRKKYPDWHKIVPNLLKKTKKKRKLNLETKNDKKNSESIQENKEGDSHSESENEEENGLDNYEESGSENALDSGSENAEESESENAEESESENAEESESKNAEDSESEKKEKEEDAENENHKTYQDENDENKDSSDEMSSSSVNDEISRVKSKKTVSKKLNKNKGKMKETSKNSYVAAKPVEDKPKVIDPFFVTSTNEEYTTSQVPISRGESLPSNKKEHFGQNKTGKFSNFDNKKKWEKPDSDWKNRKFNRFQESAPYRGQNTGGFDKYSLGNRTDKLVFGNRKERRKALLQPQVEEKIEKLHPSWKAKKKQSSIIPFQGKKVTFD